MIVTAPHASVAVAVPNAAVISDAVGLHPSVNVVPVALILGGVRSAVHETVLEIVDVLPQPSVAVKVLVCEAIQPIVEIGPSDDVIVGVPHPSVAVAVANAVLIVAVEGLHPNVTPAYDPVNTGPLTSITHVTLRDMVEVLPHASVAVNVLTCVRLQPVVLIPPSTEVIVGVEQISVAVAEPNAASIVPDDGLQPSDTKL